MTIKNVLYRRQVDDICRQLRFIEESKSEMRIRLNVPDKTFDKLAQLLNRLNDTLLQQENFYKTKDRKLKDALSNVSHDIRTPLTSLKGYFELVLKEEDPLIRKKYESIISERIDTLTELLEELFTYTRLQDDAYNVELSEINMTKPVLDTLFSFYEEIQARIDNPVVQAIEEPVMISGNEMAIKRLVANLIKNSLVHGSGEMRISYEVSSDNQVIFMVANTVLNASEIDIDQVFDRFYKADKARSKTSTGLGLAIAKQYVERMNGTISAAIDDNWFEIKVVLPTVKKLS